MIALDPHVLVDARRAELADHAAARELLGALAEGSALWALPARGLVDYLRTVTDGRTFDPPTRLDSALEDVARLLRSPGLRLMTEAADHWSVLGQVLRDHALSGDDVERAHLVALCQTHGVTELRSNDAGFRRFRGLVVRPAYGAVRTTLPGKS